MKRAILVTGGAGFVGSHACKSLAAEGYQPIVYDSLVRGNRDAVRWGPLEVGDIGDAARLTAVVRRYRPGAVMHFAAFAYPQESIEEPEKYRINNVEGTRSLLAVLKAEGVHQIIFSSTCAVYGNAAAAPLSETAALSPISPYGSSKVEAEKLLQKAAAWGLASIALRYFNAAGADPDKQIGEDHDPEPHLIPRILAAAEGSLPTIGIYGTDYPTPDGTAVRDYVHVSDLADAHVAALRSLDGGAGLRVFNLGSGHGYSVRDIITAAERLTGRSIPAFEAQRRAGDPPSLVADAAKATREIGWIPRRSDLDSIISSAWGWRRHRRPATLHKSQSGVQQINE